MIDGEESAQLTLGGGQDVGGGADLVDQAVREGLVGLEQLAADEQPLRLAEAHRVDHGRLPRRGPSQCRCGVIYVERAEIAGGYLEPSGRDQAEFGLVHACDAGAGLEIAIGKERWHYLTNR